MDHSRSQENIRGHAIELPVAPVAIKIHRGVREGEVATDGEIEIPVVVEVRPRHARAPAVHFAAQNAIRHGLKSSIAAIRVNDVALRGARNQINPTVVVEVTPRRAQRPRAAPSERAVRHKRETGDDLQSRHLACGRARVVRHHDGVIAGLR